MASWRPASCVELERHVTSTASPSPSLILFVACILVFLQQQLAGVRLVNSSEILEFLDLVPNATRSRCTVVLFYYPSCVFSSRAAPHFNALGRIFPQIHVLALDAYSHNGYDSASLS